MKISSNLPASPQRRTLVKSTKERAPEKSLTTAIRRPTRVMVDKLHSAQTTHRFVPERSANYRSQMAMDAYQTFSPTGRDSESGDLLGVDVFV